MSTDAFERRLADHALGTLLLWQAYAWPLALTIRVADDMCLHYAALNMALALDREIARREVEG